MNHSFARKLSVSTPVRGTGAMVGVPDLDSPAKIEGVGAVSQDVKIVASAAAVYGVMFYGVTLAIKGSLLAGGAAFIGGPIVVTYALTKMLAEV